MIKGFNADSTNHIQFKLSTLKSDSKCLIITLKGLVDTYNSQYFTRQVEKLIEAGYTKLIFNFYGLTYMSSTGIGSMIAILKVVKAIPGAGMVIYNINPKVYEVFKLLGMTGFFNFIEDEREALLFFRKAVVKEVEKIPEVSKRVPNTAQPFVEIETPKPTLFPIIIACPSCNKRMRAPRPGRFRCACKTILTINTLGEVRK